MKTEIIGYEKIDEETLRCSKCNVQLVNVILTEENKDRVARGQEPMRVSYVCRCYRCDGVSNESKVFEGTTYFASVNPSIGIDQDNLVDKEDGSYLMALVTMRSEDEG